MGEEILTLEQILATPYVYSVAQITAKLAEKGVTYNPKEWYSDEVHAAVITLALETLGKFPKNPEIRVGYLMLPGNLLAFYVSQLDENYAFYRTPREVLIEGKVVPLVTGSYGKVEVRPTYEDTLEEIRRSQEETYSRKWSGSQPWPGWPARGRSLVGRS